MVLDNADLNLPLPGELSPELEYDVFMPTIKGCPLPGAEIAVSHRAWKCCITRPHKISSSDRMTLPLA